MTPHQIDALHILSGVRHLSTGPGHNGLRGIRGPTIASLVKAKYVYQEFLALTNTSYYTITDAGKAALLATKPLVTTPAHTIRLSHTQREALRRMAISNQGFEAAPGGYSAAGRDASRWWRTMRVLANHGLVHRLEGSDGYVITSDGRGVAAQNALAAG